jgi:hypothetical protein
MQGKSNTVTIPGFAGGQLDSVDFSAPPSQCRVKQSAPLFHADELHTEEFPRPPESHIVSDANVHEHGSITGGADLSAISLPAELWFTLSKDRHWGSGSPKPVS